MTTPRVRLPAPLPRHVRAMLASYRHAHEIPAEIEARIWSVVGADDAPAPACDPPPAPAPRRAGLRALGWAGAMLAVAALLLLAWRLGGALAERRTLATAPGAAVMQGGGDPSQGQTSAGRVEPRASEPASVPAPLVAPAARPDLDPALAEPEADLDPRRRPRRPAPDPDPDPATAEPEVPASTLAAERALVAEAWRALALGETSQALDTTREHARRFPTGLLAPERVAIETIAHCRQGAADGSRRATAFHRAHPRSPLAARVDEACGASPHKSPASP
jgi:hypothetical protein